MTSRSPEQQAALDAIYHADQEYRAKKRTAEREAKLAAEAQVSLLNAARVNLVGRALALGLSKNIIGKQGLSTSAPDAVNRLMGLSNDIGTVFVPTVATGPFSWIDHHSGTIRVNYPMYPGKFAEEGWDGSLRGIVIRAPEAKTGWNVLQDPSDKPSQFGVIPGALRTVLDAGQQPLLDELNEWAGKS